MTENITWQANEFRHYEKSYGWYITLGAVTVLVVGFFILEKDIFAGICLAVIAGFVVFFAKQKPGRVEIEINSKSIRFGNLLFPYKQIKHFWVVNNQNHRTLNFHTTAILNNIIILELEDQDPEIVRDFLINYIPEHPETEETPAQRIMHKLKF